MSAASDKFEQDVAKEINKLPGIKASRPSVGTDFSDVKVEYKNIKTWVEVKMSHTDNLSNPRVYYEKGQWRTTYKTPTAFAAVEILNKSQEAKKFIDAISKYSGIPKKDIKIPTTKSGLKEPGAVPLHVMKSFFDQPGINRYIANDENRDLGKRLNEVEKLIIPFLQKLYQTADKEYIYWPNRKPVIEKQIERILKLTRG